MTRITEDRAFDRHPRRRGAVLIIGAGAVGGLLAEELARAGISPLVLVDPDLLEVENLVRHPLGAASLGRPKSTELAERIRADFPLCEAVGIRADFLQLRRAEQRRLVNEADLVVAATDNFECQRQVNRVCFAAEQPAVFPAVWVDRRLRDAEVGEVLWVVPGRHTPCYECAVAFRQASADAQAARGTRRDIQLLVNVTTQVVTDLLDLDDPRSRILDPGRTCIYVHGFTPTSPGIRDSFPTHGLRNVNVHVPFPETPCPGCGGREPSAPGPDPSASNQAGRPTSIRVPASSSPSRGLGFSVAAAVAAVLGLIFVVAFALHRTGSPSSSSASRSNPSAPLPATASTAFNVTPIFNGNAATVTGHSDDDAGNQVQLSMTPSLAGFKLTVQVTATYSAAAISNVTGSLAAQFGDNCLDINAPGASSEFPERTYEAPIEQHLSSSGAVVSGSLVYAAVVPGVYSFDLNCLNGDGAGQSSTVDIGTVETTNLGVIQGPGVDSSFVVYGIEKSKTDTVILYGTIGSTTVGFFPGWARPTSGTCIFASATPTSNPVPVEQSTQSTYQDGSGGSAWYELGTLTFNVSASHLSGGAQFYHECTSNNGGGIVLH